MLMEVNEHTNLRSIVRPYIPYDMYCELLREKRSVSNYMKMLQKAYTVSLKLNESIDTKREILKTYLSQFDKNTWVIQAYKHRIVANLDKFWLIVNPVGFVDYVDIDLDGSVSVIAPLSCMPEDYNTMNRFNEIIESLDCIPLLIHDNTLFDLVLKDSEPCKEYDSFLKNIKTVEFVLEPVDGSGEETVLLCVELPEKSKSAFSEDAFSEDAFSEDIFSEDEQSKENGDSINKSSGDKKFSWVSLVSGIFGFVVGVAMFCLLVPLFTTIYNWLTSLMSV